MTEEEKALRLYELAKEKGDKKLQRQALEKAKKARNLAQEIQSTNWARPFELTARYGAEGLAGLADVATGPIKAGLNQLGFNYGTDTYSQAVSGGLDTLGFARPETKGEKIVGQASRFMAGGSPFVRGGQLLSSVPGVLGRVGQTMATAPGLQAASAASAGMGGEYAKQSNWSPSGQFAASLVSGLLPAAGYGGLLAAKSLLPVSRNAKQVVNNLDLTGISVAARKRIEAKVDQALKTGDLDPAALKRMIDFERVQATPTTASLTLDPILKTQQKNLAKAGAQSSNPNLQRLARLEHDNNRALIQQLDELAGGAEYDPYIGGQAAIKPVAAKQAELVRQQGLLYRQARDTSGRALPLDRAQFINRVDDLLVADNATAFLPREIKTMLNQISRGEIKIGKQTHRVPFNVDTIDALKTKLATEQRSAKGSAKHAIGLVRQALDETQLQGGASDDAMLAFDKARAATLSLKRWEESAPAIKAIVEGATPDQFMDKYILPKSASVKDVSKLVDEVKADPDAFNALKLQVAAWIKDKAIPTRVEGEGVLRSSSMNNALKKIGDRKLKLFFSEGEIETMKATNRVAFYEQYQPVGSAINNSNTATTFGGNLLNFVTDRSPTLRTLNTALRGVDSLLFDAGRARQMLNPPLLAPRPAAPKGMLAAPLSMTLLPQNQ